MHFVFILLNLESQDLRKYFEYITPVARQGRSAEVTAKTGKRGTIVGGFYTEI